MLRVWKILSLGASTRLRIRSLQIEQNGGGVPSTIWSRNLMACTWTTPLTVTMSGNKKRRKNRPTIRNKGIIPLEPNNKYVL